MTGPAASVSGLFLAAGVVFTVLAARHFIRAKKAARHTAHAWRPMIVHALLAAVFLAAGAGIAIQLVIG